MGFGTEFQQFVRNPLGYLGDASEKAGKEIKRTLKKAGKFAKKIGVAGTIGLMFIMPGVGNYLSQGLTNITNGLLGMDNPIAQGLGSLLEFTNRVATDTRNYIGNVSSAIIDTTKNFAKTAAKKLGFDVKDASDTFFGEGDSAYSRSFGVDSKFQNLQDNTSDTALTKAFTEAGVEADSVIIKDQFAVPTEDIVTKARTPVKAKDANKLGDVELETVDLTDSVYYDNIQTVMPEADTLEIPAYDATAINLDIPTPAQQDVRDEASRKAAADAAEEDKPSLLQRSKDYVVDTAIKTKDAILDTASDAPAMYGNYIIEGKAQEKAGEYLYGTEEEQLQQAIEEQRALDAARIGQSAGMLQFQNNTGGASDGITTQYTTQYQAQTSNPWGYNAYQSNVYGNRMSQFSPAATSY